MNSSKVGLVVIMAAGRGTRMASPGPKVLQELCGRPMLGYVVDQALTLEPSRILVVVGHGAEAVEAYLGSEKFGISSDLEIRCVLQAEQKGTGHAVLVCLEELERAKSDGIVGPVVILSGDMPLYRASTLSALVSEWAAKSSDGGAAILTSEPPDARGFGREIGRAHV